MSGPKSVTDPKKILNSFNSSDLLIIRFTAY